MQYIKDRTGKVIGTITEINGRKTYTDAGGRVVARVIENKTYDAAGRYYGTGDQGSRLLTN